MRTYLSFINKAKAGASLVALSSLVASVLFVSSGAPVSAAGTSAPVRQASAPFLTLPFEANSSMSVLSGWYYSSSGGFHGGIDYISGNVNSSRGWSTFPVIASADGEACGNCSSRQGNAVWVKHNVNGSTFYTYYGHLASISKDIPLGSQSRTISVKRGQFLGWAGDTGARGALHLHFALYNSSSRPLDPYSIGKLRQYYPKPLSNAPGLGWFLGN
ncbi:MAG TPA: M23 family metallopeptidase [Chloroflexia bacterium]|nr:M23 family metallopeptidase [Chloroflexia bacterium]